MVLSNLSNRLCRFSFFRNAMHFFSRSTLIRPVRFDRSRALFWIENSMERMALFVIGAKYAKGKCESAGCISLDHAQYCTRVFLVPNEKMNCVWVRLLNRIDIFYDQRPPLFFPISCVCVCVCCACEWIQSNGYSYLAPKNITDTNAFRLEIHRTSRMCMHNGGECWRRWERWPMPMEGGGHEGGCSKAMASKTKELEWEPRECHDMLIRTALVPATLFSLFLFFR